MTDYPMYAPMDEMDAARNTAEDNGGATVLAIRMGKSPTTLLHELKGTGGAKLGLKDASKLMRAAGDYRILHTLAQVHGFVAIPLPAALAVEGNSAMLDLSRVAKEFGDVVQEVSASLSDGSISANELARIERQYQELMAAGGQMLSRLRAQHEEAKPQALRAVNG